MMKKYLCCMITSICLMLIFGSSVFAEETTQLSEKNIHITFANNSYMKIDYYSDKAMTDLISDEKCYLNKGDKIYASKPIMQNAKSNLYRFDCYRIWSYNSEDNSRQLIAKTKIEEGLIWEIPNDLTSTEISIEPLGGYDSRELDFNTFCINEMNEENEEPNVQELNDGVWTVNDKRTKEVSPVESYKVKYDYSNYKDSYYVLSATPECLKINDSDNIVVFKNTSSLDNVNSFTVQMHPYITLRIKDPYYNIFNYVPFWERNVIQKVEKNGDTVHYQQGSNEKITKLKVDDNMIIRVASNYKLIGKGLNVGEPLKLDNGYEYSFKIPDTLSDELEITLGKRSEEPGAKVSVAKIDNADVTLYNKNGTELKDEETAPADGETIKVSISPYKGYYVSGDGTDEDSYEKEMSYADYKNNFDEILLQHEIKKFLTVTLNDYNDFGKCIYKLNGDEIKGTQSFKEGQTIEMQFKLDDDDFKIKRDWLGNMFSLFSPNEFTTSIEITKEMDHSEIDCNKYIEVERK